MKSYNILQNKIYIDDILNNHQLNLFFYDKYDIYNYLKIVKLNELFQLVTLHKVEK